MVLGQITEGKMLLGRAKAIAKHAEELFEELACDCLVQADMRGGYMTITTSQEGGPLYSQILGNPALEDLRILAQNAQRNVYHILGSGKGSSRDIGGRWQKPAPGAIWSSYLITSVVGFEEDYNEYIAITSMYRAGDINQEELKTVMSKSGNSRLVGHLKLLN